MAIGEWTDNRSTWFFQKVVASSDLDSMCENDHRLLVQAGMQFTYGYDSSHPLWQSNTTRNIKLDAITEMHMMFSTAIWDRCPWNRLRIATYVVAMSGTALVLKLQRSSGNPATASATDVITLTEADLVADAWNVWCELDITGLAPGDYTWAILWDLDTPMSIELGPTHVSLMSTVTGLVS